MKGDGEGESERARKNDYGKLNNDVIKVSRRRFIKTSAAFGAAVAGIPYNLTDITDIFKEDGELVIHPLICEFKFEFANKHKPRFKRMIGIEPWGCNWNCRWCRTKFYPRTGMIPIRISIDQIMDLLLKLDGDRETMLAIGGEGEPLLQKEEMLKLIDSLKTNTNYTVVLLTNGSLIKENFIDEANDLSLDGIMIYFPYLDDERHRWYTGHSNENTIKTLELVTKKFKGLAVVSMILFSDMDMTTFENTCSFLHDINPNFIIRIACPHSPYHENKECVKKGRRHKAEEIALRYFRHMDRTADFSKQFKNIRYQIEEDESGRLNLVKIQERTWIKKGGEFVKYG